MSLAIQYRPTSFDEVVGNEATVQSLRTVLARPAKDIPHAMLFSGPSGCGKTTLARLVASAMKCGPMDLTEMDSAHFRGVDTVRDMRSTAFLSPVSGGVRVWILDEVHQFTKDAQSALLKLLEDAPPKGYFLLATTDPDKLLPTVRNRCMSFVVSPLTEQQIIQLLTEVLETEGKTVPDRVLRLIGQNCLGSARTALMALDQIIDLPVKEMESSALRAIEADSAAIELFRALLAGRPWGTIAEILRRLPTDLDPETVRRGALQYAAAVLTKGDNGRAFVMLDAFREPYFNTGRPGLVYSCYLAAKG